MGGRRVTVSPTQPTECNNKTIIAEKGQRSGIGFLLLDHQASVSQKAVRRVQNNVKLGTACKLKSICFVHKSSLYLSKQINSTLL